MRRARKLKQAIKQFIRRHPEEKLENLTATEWKHIDYLIEILYPFYKYTRAISKSADFPTVHQVFDVYNQLFSHLETQIEALELKRQPWKVLMRTALQNARTKLDEYYSMTCDHVGNIYAAATILAPEHKLDFFETEEWDDDKGRYYWVSISLSRYSSRYIVINIASVIPIVNFWKGQSQSTPIELKTPIIHRMRLLLALLPLWSHRLHNTPTSRPAIIHKAVPSRPLRQFRARLIIRQAKSENRLTTLLDSYQRNVRRRVRLQILLPS